MSDKISLKEFIQNFENGMYDKADINTMIEAGWFDWFCNDKSLKSKLHKLFPKVKMIAQSAKIDMEKMYVFFKNNCPVNGKLYDDFRICELETGDIVYTITPSCGHERVKGQAQVWSRENYFEKPLVSGTWKEVKAFFGIGGNK